MSTDTPQRRLREQLHQKRSELILEVAEEILIRKGYHNASMDEIAAQAGVAKGTLYQHFPTKEDLFFTLIEQALARFEQLVRQVAASSLNARQKLERIFQYIYGEQRAAHIHLLQLLHNNADMSQRLHARKSQTGERINQAIDEIRTIFEEGKAEGLFDIVLETELMLHLFLCLLSLSHLEQVVGSRLKTPEELLIQLERCFFEGIQLVR
jgi:AcrR family transcriptional regulator